MNPEYLAPVADILHDAGAREVHVIPAHTKKGRTGVLLRVLAPLARKKEVADAVLEYSGSAGLRYWQVDREICEREFVEVQTDFGPVKVKRWKTPSGRWRAKPEFRDVWELSSKAGIPADELRDLVMAGYLSEVKDGQEED
jgi:uncharacterized protein (DUF111 family)